MSHTLLLRRVQQTATRTVINQRNKYSSFNLEHQKLVSLSKQVVQFMCNFCRQHHTTVLSTRNNFSVSRFVSSRVGIHLQNTAPFSFIPESPLCNAASRSLHTDSRKHKSADLNAQGKGSFIPEHSRQSNIDQSNLATETEQPRAWSTSFSRPTPQLNWEFLCNPSNRDAIRSNNTNRKGVGDIDKLCQFWELYQQAESEKQKQILWEQVLAEGLDIPNTSHPEAPIGDESKAEVVEVHSQKRDFDFEPKTVVELGEQLQMLRTDNVAMTTGPRTYYFLGDLARLEQALVRFALDRLKKKGFKLISVPDMLHPDVIESCGFKTKGERTQVYHLNPDHGQACLAGTAEMSLGGYFMNETQDIKDLPVKVAAVSRCYRAETSDISEEKGIYRVHQFTKVEMFVVTTTEGKDESGQLLHEFLDIERELFMSLGLHFRVLNMPTEELGAPAHRKYDVETWMPGKGFWGEISSTSNCTDFQSRRLNIRYRDGSGNLQFAHTVNGTACAVPRMVMALVENNQQQDGTVQLPEVLHAYMGTSSLRPPARKDPFIRIQDRRKK